ncbi:hypothetical protein PUV54_00170 [Hyphococcus flavus]|uniref:NusG-like N-terminal domain-containing protein n=1 Tax=Hyphococcus flavus TaxID=1866326 RepID=A0AAE9ZEZ1_9PROT|nr:hypothetical protein [Hyphococcus flavus]WDI31608.1 hypothetical protein PUV54_00170 [Hyphococcus flavus]
MYKRANRYTAADTLAPCDVWATPQWHLIRVQIDKVFTVAAILQKCGLKAWAPLQTGWIKIGPNRMRVRHRPVDHPAFFNYLFVGISDPSHWRALFQTNYVRAMVAIETADGPRPFAVAPHVVNGAMARQRKGNFRPEQLRRRLPAFGEGDMVRTIETENPWSGQVLRVQAIEESKARVLGELLGKEIEFEISLDALCKAA